MALKINHAILHVLGKNGADSYFSREELDHESESCYEFISRHVGRLVRNPAAKEACFSAQSGVYALVTAYQKEELRFIELSVKLCERLLAVMERGADIPAADVLVAHVENGAREYLALLKLNYMECFTHRVNKTEYGAENQIVKNTAVLPVAGGKVEDAVLIPYDPMVLRILEKPCEIDGRQTDYFSELFLECETQMSRKETAELLSGVIEEIGEKHFGGDPEIAAQIKCALIDEAGQAEDEGSFRLESIARRVFSDKEEIGADFLATAQELGLSREVKLDKGTAKRQFRMQTFKAENGVELKCPAELFGDADSVLVVQNGDGSVSITLKNLRRA